VFDHKGLDTIQILCYPEDTGDGNTMILSKEKIGILVVVLIAAGGILIFAGQHNKALLTADISEVVEPAPQPQTSPVPLVAQKVWVSPTSVSAGEDITVTVDTADIVSFILFVDVYLESTNSGATIQGSIVNIDGEGRKFGSITIPSDAEQGEWVIKRVSIVDASGGTTDYHDSQDMTAVFTIISL